MSHRTELQWTTSPHAPKGRRSSLSVPSPLRGFVFLGFHNLGLSPQATDLSPFGAAVIEKFLIGDFDEILGVADRAG
jgi:hypothetical protein